MSIDIVELRRVLAEEAERTADKKTEDAQQKAAEKSHRESEEMLPWTITGTDFVSEKIRHLLDGLLKYAGEKGKAELKARTGLDVDTIRNTLSSRDPAAAARKALGDLKTKAESAAATATARAGTVADGVREAGNRATAEAGSAATAASVKVEASKEAAKSLIDNTTQNRGSAVVAPTAARSGAAEARRTRAAAVKERVQKLKELGDKMDSDISTAKGNVAARVEAKAKQVDSYKSAGNSGRDQNLTVDTLKTKLKRITEAAKSGTQQERVEALNRLQAIKDRIQPESKAGPARNEIQAGPAGEPGRRTDPYYRPPPAPEAAAAGEEL
tara:strand:- start:287 stop:1270 length:984 start_codon:yes stop_codon:yes gene_type:complete